MGTLLSRISLYLNAGLLALLLISVIYALHERNDLLSYQVKMTQQINANNAKVTQAINQASQNRIEQLQQEVLLDKQVAEKNAAGEAKLQASLTSTKSSLQKALQNEKDLQKWYGRCLPSALIYGLLHEPNNPACPNTNNKNPGPGHR